MLENLKKELSNLKEKVNIRYNTFEEDDFEKFLKEISQENSSIKLQKDTFLGEKPIFLIEKDKISIKFLGKVSGGEVKSFLDSIKIVANNEYHISSRILEFAQEIDKPVDIKVFTTNSCGWCHPAILKAVSFSVVNPNIKVSIIDCYSFPELAMKYNVSAVPKIVINDKVEFVGARDDNEFFGYIVKALGEVWKLIEIGLLGSTGSVGTQVLDIVRKNKDKIKVKLLGASKPSEKLLSQIKEFNPRYVYIESGELLNFKNTKVFVGENSLDFLRDLDLDLFIIAIAGVKGIKPTYILLESNKKVATANKEAIICLGELEKDKYKNIIPIDSEHSAIFQIIDRKPLDDVRRIILTASGGPFLNLPLKELENVTIDQTLNHPRWSMGKKISVDSATLINKGFEVIEAHYLFNIPYEKIDVVIHPESIIHGMVEYIDGTVIANMSNPDMRIPISYAIFYPERKYINNNYLDFTKLKSLNFLTPDYKKFPLLKVAIECGKKAGVYPTALTMADEVAVNLYLQGKIKFLDIYKIVIEVIESVKNDKINSIQDLLEFIKYVEKYSLLIAEKYGSSWLP